MTVSFYEKGYTKDLGYSVIISKDDSGYVFVKHKDRDTWEIPGGHIETNESSFEAAKRELIEETGAKKFTLQEVCIYSVNRGESKSYGSLFFAEISEFSGSLDYEIREIKSFKELPKHLTYPAIQPFLFKEVIKRVYVENNIQ